MNPFLHITGLTKRYGTITALQNLDLTVAAGEMFVLLGGSGCGKTTLLRCLGGFERAEAGRITLDGTDITDTPAYRRPVNTMFQSYALFPHMNVAENIGFGLRQAGLPRAEIATRVGELLQLIRLSDHATRRPDQLSGGQSQRVALARALARRQKLLLLDEPLSALDPNLRAETRAELIALQRALAMTFIVVTHDQEEALAMASRIGVMRDGALAQIGTPAEIYERPTSRFVAEFLGVPNFLPATVKEVGIRGTHLRLDGSASPIRVTMKGPLGQKILLALRPERLRLNGSDPNILEGTLHTSEYRGEAMQLTVRLADGTALRVHHPLTEGLATPLPDIGATVKLTFAPDAGIVLPA